MELCSSSSPPNSLLRIMQLLWWEVNLAILLFLAIKKERVWGKQVPNEQRPSFSHPGMSENL